MGSKWILHKKGSFSDGNDIWDFLRIKALDLDTGTELWLSRPRLNQRIRVSRVVYDVRGKKVWHWLSQELKLEVDRSDPFQPWEILLYPQIPPFKVGDEVELVESSSPAHVLVQ